MSIIHSQAWEREAAHWGLSAYELETEGRKLSGKSFLSTNCSRQTRGYAVQGAHGREVHGGYQSTARALMWEGLHDKAKCPTSHTLVT